MSAPTPALEGFHSTESKRSVTRTAWVGGVLIALLQFAVPVVFVGWAFVHSIIGAFSTPQPEVEAPAASEGLVWYTAPVPAEEGEELSLLASSDTRTLLQIPRGQSGKPTAVATFEGGLRDPVLFATEGGLLGGLLILGEDYVATFADGELTRRDFDEALPRSAWPVGLGDEPAVIVLERDYDGGSDDHALSLRTFDGSRWNIRWTDTAALPWGPDEVRAVAIGEDVHVFASGSDDVVRHAVRTVAGLGPWSATPVEAMDWSAAALDGQPAVVALEETELSTFVRGWRHGDGWQPLFREEVEAASSIGATTLRGAEGEQLGVLTDALLDGVVLFEVTAAGDVVARNEHSASTVLDEAIGMIVVSQVAPFVLTLGFAWLVSASMGRHRVGAFEFEGRTVRYASVAKRGAAKAIDSLLALAVPAAILGPEIMDGQMDEMRVAVVCMLWALPLGLAITAWEGARGWTPGKRLLGIRVVGLDLKPPGFGPAFMRGLMGIADGFFSYVVGIVIVALHPRWQRMGDQVAHTLVIED